MQVMFILLPLAILMAAAALLAFFWAAHRGQFDDLDTPRYRALFDDDPAPKIPIARSDDALCRNTGNPDGP